ncbi:MAG: CxxC-x17-CxxC domain-containing protein, partial [Candidatus Heimdallarchaeaceae archaeon]
SNRSSSRYDDRNRTLSDSGSKRLHNVICSKCKKETQVPFKPTGAKPVYCRECFQDQKSKTESTPVKEERHVKDDEVVERFGGRTGPYRTNKRMHSTTCRTCKKDIMIPFKPKARKPIYCQDCFQEIGKKK